MKKVPFHVEMEFSYFKDNRNPNTRTEYFNLTEGSEFNYTVPYSQFTISFIADWMLVISNANSSSDKTIEMVFDYDHHPTLAS